MISSCNHPERKLTSSFLILASWLWLCKTFKEIRSRYVIVWRPFLNNTFLKGTLMLQIISMSHFSLQPLIMFAFSPFTVSDNKISSRYFCYLRPCHQILATHHRLQFFQLRSALFLFLWIDWDICSCSSGITCNTDRSG